MSVPVDPALQAEYDNRAKVPGHAAIMDGWARDAAAFRAAWPHTALGVAYGPGERQRMDVFRPDAAAAPVAMFIHGGYWQALDRSWFSHLAHGLVRCGVAVAVPSYDLCPTVTLATICAQMEAAAGACGAVYAFGHSAGGHLTAMLLASGTVAGGTALSGLFDLEPLRHTTIGAALALDAAEARRLSPVFLPRPAGRLHAVVGGAEGAEYARQARDITNAWGGTWSLAEDADHFTIVAPLAVPGSALVSDIFARMRA